MAVYTAEPAAAPMDPFAVMPTPAPRRPRLLSYIGRWGRARHWLPRDALRILDVGCSFGYGSAAVMARGPAGRRVVGVELDPAHLEHGRASFPWVRILRGDSTALPLVDSSVDAVLFLDVLEHLECPERALAEARRILRPDGVTVISVPHRGLLRGLDSLNLYSELRRRHPTWPPLEAATESGSGRHRHFSLRELTDLLEPDFVIDRVARTGFGLQELLYLALLLIRVPLGAENVCRALLPLHLLLYAVDDRIRMGRLSYHLTVRARAVGSAVDA